MLPAQTRVGDTSQAPSLPARSLSPLRHAPVEGVLEVWVITELIKAARRAVCHPFQMTRSQRW